MKTLDLIRQSSLFHAVNQDTLLLIQKKSLDRSVEEGEYFFLQGDKATHAYVLTQGRVKMLEISPDGSQVALRIITPGQTFGGIALLNPPEGYPASALAMEDSAALVWDTQSLRELVEIDPSISLNTMQIMHGYIQELQQRQHALVSQRVEQRIAHTLLKLASQSGKKTEKGVLIVIPLTRQDVAEMSGTTLFTVSRTLKEWERQGVLETGREKVLIRDPHGLVRIAEDL
jgi:CRP-like cAMP-binding protein